MATNWDTLVAIHGPAVWATCCRLLGNRKADAEECYQETWLAAWKAADGRAIVSWPSFLCRIATSRSIDRLRQRYRQQAAIGPPRSPQHEDLAGLASDGATPVELAVASELSERLRIALAELPERQAEVFSLHVLSDQSQPEIATLLDMTVNAVGVSLHRARERLRQLLGEAN
ncbi:MAG TPA: RNA polymerase sigma factor [Caulifigura sp.]|jgi:RNA polymerase sigma-70 factor (ECF subfamily)|nr:RNA polymerase sigma factor [Caulifigura sp.]